MNTLPKTAHKVICALVTISIVGMAIIPMQARPGTSRGSKKSEVVTSDAVVLQWNEIATTRILPNGPPFTAARFMTIVQLAVFEAVNSITGKYQPYLGTISAPAGASPEAAA